MIPAVLGDAFAPTSPTNQQVGVALDVPATFSEVMQPLLVPAENSKIEGAEPAGEDHSKAEVIDQTDDTIDALETPIDLSRMVAFKDAPTSKVMTETTDSSDGSIVSTEVDGGARQNAAGVQATEPTAKYTEDTKPPKVAWHPIAQNLMAEHERQSGEPDSVGEVIADLAPRNTSNAQAATPIRPEIWPMHHHSTAIKPLFDSRPLITSKDDEVGVVAPLTTAIERTSSSGQPTIVPFRHTTDAARAVINQVAVAVTTQGAGTVEIALNPQELGRVTMQMVTQDATVTLQITGDRPETLELLRRHIDLLAQELGQLGYDDMSFSFAQSGHEETDQDGKGAQTKPQDVIEGVTVEASKSILRVTSGIDIRI